MSKTTPKTKKPRKPKKANAGKPDFHKQTVLFKWAMSRLGVSDLKDFRDRFQLSPDSPEGISQHTGNHHFYEAIVNALPTVEGVIPADRLAGYEQNILEHTQAINVSRMHHGQPKID